MKAFLDQHFLLENPTANRLYHDHARDMPIIDYHNHLDPRQMWEDRRFENLTAAWLEGDHYKWRAMRWMGVNEKFITGDATPWEKFEKWAETVPYLIRNPLYHWTHLELQRYFGIRDVLNPESARKIFDTCSVMLQSPEFSVRNLLRKMKVEVVCTTDDPADTLEYHQLISGSDIDIKVLPSFRPDKVIAVEDTDKFGSYIRTLEIVSDIGADRYQGFLDVLRHRHDHFHAQGCKAADHGLTEIFSDDFSDAEVAKIYDKLRMARAVSVSEKRKFKSAVLYHLAVWNHERGWVQQYHIGAMRNNNSRKFEELGPDTGWDSMGSSADIRSIGKFLDRLDQEDRLTRTILYSINPYDSEMLTTMAGNFNDGQVPGKIQCGAPWWFNDQKTGIIQHLDAVSNMGVLSRFVGMLTDSRSYLSFPRHEYFRRILCNVLGKEMENGELPADMDWIGKIIRDICYHNTKHFFGF